MLFVDIGDNTIVNLAFIQSMDFNNDRTVVKVSWSSGQVEVYKGDKASRLIKRVLDKMPENWPIYQESPLC